MKNIDISLNLKRLLFLQFRRYGKCLNDKLIAKGISPRSEAQSEVLMVLNGGDCTISAIAEKIGISRQAVHKTVQELVHDGWLMLRVGEKRNSKIVSFTAYGIAQRALIVETIAEIEQSIAEHLGDEKITQLREILSEDWEAFL